MNKTILIDSTDAYKILIANFNKMCRKLVFYWSQLQQ